MTEKRMTDVYRQQMQAHRRHLRQVIAAALAVLKQIEGELGTSTTELEMWLIDQIRK